MFLNFICLFILEIKNIIVELVVNHLKTKNVLKLYMPIHSGDKEYHCGICEKSFIQKVNFIAHKFIHTELNHIKVKL